MKLNLEHLEQDGFITRLERRKFTDFEDFFETYRKHWEAGNRILVMLTVNYKVRSRAGRNGLRKESGSCLFYGRRGKFEGGGDGLYFYLTDCFRGGNAQGSVKVIDLEKRLNKAYFKSTPYEPINSLKGIELVGFTSYGPPRQSDGPMRSLF